MNIWVDKGGLAEDVGLYAQLKHAILQESTDVLVAFVGRFMVRSGATV